MRAIEMNRSAAGWMRGNLTTQGYLLSDAERRELWLGLRFSIGLCLAPVIAGLALRSAVVLFAVVPIGAWAGFAARHPFDYVWNGALRHLFGAPALPPNPARRRHAFKLATVWLAGAARGRCDDPRPRARRSTRRRQRHRDRHQPLPAVRSARPSQLVSSRCREASTTARIAWRRAPRALNAKAPRVRGFWCRRRRRCHRHRRRIAGAGFEPATFGL
jgi:hypothetical protein